MPWDIKKEKIKDAPVKADYIAVKDYETGGPLGVFFKKGTMFNFVPQGTVSGHPDHADALMVVQHIQNEGKFRLFHVRDNFTCGDCSNDHWITFDDETKQYVENC